MKSNIPHTQRKSYKRWALPGQNTGKLTRKQQGQSRADKKRHAESKSHFAIMKVTSNIPYKPWSICSRCNW